jgi:GNAT superfamily N-acetyltransferase
MLSRTPRSISTRKLRNSDLEILRGLPLRMTTHSTHNVQIRIASVDEIIDLRWTILRAGLPRESASFPGDHEPATHHFAALLNDEPIGCVTLLQAPFKEERAWQLRGMAVKTEHQKLHIGSRLLTFAIPFVLSQRHSNLLWCNARVLAIGFYQRLGWQIVSEPFDVPTAGPHVKMIKRFDP